MPSPRAFAKDFAEWATSAGASPSLTAQAGPSTIDLAALHAAVHAAGGPAALPTPAAWDALPVSADAPVPPGTYHRLYDAHLAAFDAARAGGGADDAPPRRARKQARLDTATPAALPPAGATPTPGLGVAGGGGTAGTTPAVSAGGGGGGGSNGGDDVDMQDGGGGGGGGHDDQDGEDRAIMTGMLAYVRRLGLRGALPSARPGLLVSLPPNTAAGAAAKEAAKYARRARVALRCANLGERPRNVAGQGARWRAALAAEEAFLGSGLGGRLGGGGDDRGDREDGGARRSGRQRAAPTFFAQTAWDKDRNRDGSDSESSSMVWSVGGPGGARADSPSRVARAARRAATRVGPAFQCDLPDVRPKPSAKKDAPLPDGTTAAMDAAEKAWLARRVLVPGGMGVPPGVVAPLLGPAPPPTAPDAVGDALAAADRPQAEWTYATATGADAVAAVTGAGLKAGAGDDGASKAGTPGPDGKGGGGGGGGVAGAAGAPAVAAGPPSSLAPPTLPIPSDAVAAGLGLGTMGPPAASGWSAADAAAFASALAAVGRQVLVWGLPLPEDMRSSLASAGAGVGGGAGGCGAGAVPGGVGMPGGPDRPRTPWECADFYYNVWKARSTPSARLWYLKGELSFADAAHAAAGGVGPGMVLPPWLAAAVAAAAGPPGAAKVPGSGGLSFASLTAGRGTGDAYGGGGGGGGGGSAPMTAAPSGVGGDGRTAAATARSEVAMEAQRKRRMREMAAWARECGRAAPTVRFDLYGTRLRRFRRAARAIATANVAAVTGQRGASLEVESA